MTCYPFFVTFQRFASISLRIGWMHSLWKISNGFVLNSFHSLWCLSKAYTRFQRGRISPCMPAKWASPSTAAIHNSWESTSAPTRWYPGGTCTMAFSSLPTRSRCGHTKSKQNTPTKCKDWLLMNARWCAASSAPTLSYPSVTGSQPRWLHSPTCHRASGDDLREYGTVLGLFIKLFVSTGDRTVVMYSRDFSSPHGWSINAR